MPKRVLHFYMPLLNNEIGVAIARMGAQTKIFRDNGNALPKSTMTGRLVARRNALTKITKYSVCLASKISRLIRYNKN